MFVVQYVRDEEKLSAEEYDAPYKYVSRINSIESEFYALQKDD